MKANLTSGLIGAGALAAVVAIAVFVTPKAVLTQILTGNRPLTDCDAVAASGSYWVIFTNGAAASVNFNSSTPNSDTPGFHHNVFVANKWFDLVDDPCVSTSNISTFKLHQYMSGGGIDNGEDDWAWTPVGSGKYSISVTRSDSGILKNGSGTAKTP